MPGRLLLLGGGHAHLPLIRSISDFIQRGHEVTVVSPSPVHYYTGMGPGMLGGAYQPEEIRFPIQMMVESAGGRFVEDRATRINADDRTVALRSGLQLTYDVLSVNTGSTVAPTVRIDKAVAATGRPAIFHVKPVEEMLSARRFITDNLAVRPLAIVVVGGGPAAVEAACNLQRILQESAVAPPALSTVTLISGRELLPGFSRRAGKLTRAALEELGILAITPTQAVGVTERGVETEDGSCVEADVVVMATGVVPSRLIADSDLPTGSDGSMAVNEYLHALGRPEIFGGGDCVWFTPKALGRAGVFAVRQGPVLLHNVRARLDHGGNTRLRRFHPGGAYLLLVNLGNETAVFHRRIFGVPLSFRGPLAYQLKDRIDTAFMRRFGSEANQ